mmetsp:Transcript_4041/g.8297  ORF Transcript_4041/g.8297 Transcript_4041/m.8297 type:complete len:219 (+) Transcript_4041:540-1196(+)
MAKASVLLADTACSEVQMRQVVAEVALGPKDGSRGLSVQAVDEPVPRYSITHHRAMWPQLLHHPFLQESRARLGLVSIVLVIAALDADHPSRWLPQDAHFWHVDEDMRLASGQGHLAHEAIRATAVLQTSAGLSIHLEGSPPQGDSSGFKDGARAVQGLRLATLGPTHHKAMHHPEDVGWALRPCRLSCSSGLGWPKACCPGDGSLDGHGRRRHALAA